jgi:hypothetical protein
VLSCCPREIIEFPPRFGKFLTSLLDLADSLPLCCNTADTGSKAAAPSARRMIMRTLVTLLLLGFSLVFNSTVLAQMPIDGQSQADVLKLLGELPPETMKNVETLGKILQQDLKVGKLTQARIQEELKSGTLERTLRDLNPEAGPLLDDIGQQMKNHPNADSLPNLLNGMVGGGQ